MHMALGRKKELEWKEKWAVQLRDFRQEGVVLRALLCVFLFLSRALWDENKILAVKVLLFFLIAKGYNVIVFSVAGVFKYSLDFQCY